MMSRFCGDVGVEVCEEHNCEGHDCECRDCDFSLSGDCICCPLYGCQKHAAVLSNLTSLGGENNE